MFHKCGATQDKKEGILADPLFGRFSIGDGGVLGKFSDPLLSGASICGGRRAARFRNAQVAGCRGLGHFVDHEFQRGAGAPCARRRLPTIT